VYKNAALAETSATDRPRLGHKIGSLFNDVSTAEFIKR
jgi:hypothetical protein